MAYLGTYPGSGKHLGSALDGCMADLELRPGRSLRFESYAIQTVLQVRLLLNGAMVGTTKPKDEQCGILFWDIPYYPGRLEVETT